MRSVFLGYLAVLDALHETSDLSIVLLKTRSGVRVGPLLFRRLVSQDVELTVVDYCIAHEVLHSFDALESLDSGVKLVVLSSQDLSLFNDAVAHGQLVHNTTS